MPTNFDEGGYVTPLEAAFETFEQHIRQRHRQDRWLQKEFLELWCLASTYVPGPAAADPSPDLPFDPPTLRPLRGNVVVRQHRRGQPVGNGSGMRGVVLGALRTARQPMSRAAISSLLTQNNYSSHSTGVLVERLVSSGLIAATSRGFELTKKGRKA
jgi:hypothetical protein